MFVLRTGGPETAETVPGCFALFQLFRGIPMGQNRNSFDCFRPPLKQCRNSRTETARNSTKQRVKQPETVGETATETAKQSPRGKRNCFAPPRASHLTRVKQPSRLRCALGSGRFRAGHHPCRPAALKPTSRITQGPHTMTDDIHDEPKQELTTTDAKPAPERRISKRIAEVVRLLLTGECKTQKAAAERVGMNETYLSEALRKPHIQVFIARRTRETIANGTLRASARLVELIDAGSEHVSADVSMHMLAIAGIKPPSGPAANVNISVMQAGYVLDLRSDEEIAAQARVVDAKPTPPREGCKDGR